MGVHVKILFFMLNFISTAAGQEFEIMGDK
jgi:hypothetical protein